MKNDDFKETYTENGMEVEKKGDSAGRLNPSFWRTVRSLKNINRLNLLKRVYDSGGKLGVTSVGSSVNVNEPLASNYLRQMNARGIISVKRNSKFVYYGTSPDRSLPRAISLQDAFREYFKHELKKGWQLELWTIMDGFSHYNRLNIIRYLAVMGKCSRAALIQSAGIMEKNFEHHFAKIKRAGIVERKSYGPKNYYYVIAPQSNPIAKTLLAAATYDLKLGNLLTDKINP